MSKATGSHTLQNLSVQQAAAEILALVNASPRTPWPFEVEAIVAKVAKPKRGLDMHDEALHVDFVRWRQLIAAADAAHRITGAVVTPEPADELVTQQAEAELAAFHTTIAERPARSIADIGLLAGLVFREHWPGRDLTDANADETMSGGPHCAGGVMQNLTLAALLEAIRDLIGMPQPLEASDAALLGRVRSAIALEHEEGLRYAEDDRLGGDDDRLGRPHADVTAWDTLHALQKSIPYPPRTATQMLCHAEIAFHGADKDSDGNVTAAFGDCCEGTAARLVEAAVAYFGGVVRL